MEKRLMREAAKGAGLNQGKGGAGRRVLVIYNPTAGGRRRRRLEAVLRHLAEAGLVVTVRPTTARGDAEAFARRAAAEGWDVVAVAGGDGTINEAINGLYGQPVPLAVIPLGTANVVAAEIGVPSAPAAIARMIAAGPAQDIHLGVANGRLFIMMAGVGFDARVVAAMPTRLKRLLGKGAYALMFLARLFEFSRGVYRVRVDDEAHTAASVVIANGRFYAGRHTCAPQARLDEPLLYACLFLRPGPWRALRYAAGLLFGFLDRLSDVLILPASRVTVDGSEGEPVQGDGDLIGRMPLEVVLAESTLRLVMPAG
jgi:YegS/Rv2252/BmrU family lipid kinase